MANIHSLATAPTSLSSSWSFVKVINPLTRASVVEMELQIEEVDVVCTGKENKNNVETKVRRVAPRMLWIHPTDTVRRVITIDVVDQRYPPDTVYMLIGQSALDVLRAEEDARPIGQTVDGKVGLSSVFGQLSECCVCDDIEFSSNYIECSNKEACLTQFFHLECMGLTLGCVPGKFFPSFACCSS